MDNLLDVPPLEGINAPQGMLAPHILVADTTVENDRDLVQAIVDFVNTVHDRAKLVPDEYPAEAIWSYHADFYLAQVNNGGHGQFAHNSWMSPRVLRDCRLGLHAMGAGDYLAIFDEFLTIMAAEDERASAIREGGGFGDIDPAIRALDSRFFELEGAMTRLNAAWLRGLPCLKPLPREELTAAFEHLAQANPARQARTDVSAAARQKFESEDDNYSAAHACAAQEGATFNNFTAGIPIGADGSAGTEWGALTSAGFRWLRVVYGEHAEWRDDKRALKALYFYATKGPYSTEVGDGTQRAAIMARKRQNIPLDLDAQFQFFLRPLANLTLTLTDRGDGKASNALIAAAAHAKSLQRMPRAAHRSFEHGREHAQFRLLVAYMFWDMSIRTLLRAHPAGFVDDYMRSAVMAAAGSISAAGAAAVRLPRVDQITALKDEAGADFRREQDNVWLQLHEVREWWSAQLWRIARAVGAWKPSGNILLRPSAFKLAERFVFEKGGETPGVDLARRMAYFDREYGADPKLATATDKAARGTLAALRADVDNFALSIAARAFEEIEKNPKPMPPTEMAYYLAEPHRVNAKSNSQLLGVLVTIEPKGAIGVDFDKNGYRKTIEK